MTVEQGVAGDLCRVFLKPIHGLTLCSPSLPLFCPSLERPSPADIWPPQPPAWPPSVPGTWPHTVSSASQSPYWLAPCRGWLCPVSANIEHTEINIITNPLACVTTSYSLPSAGVKTLTELLQTVDAENIQIRGTRTSSSVKKSIHMAFSGAVTSAI